MIVTIEGKAKSCGRAAETYLRILIPLFIGFLSSFEEPVDFKLLLPGEKTVQ